jgi:hypothetical protein
VFDMKFLFHERKADSTPGFEMGDIRICGDRATVTSEGSNQSMMLILSIVELLDGVRLFLSRSKPRQYEFIGADSSFSVIFHRERDGLVSVSVGGRLVHTADPRSIKSDIERSVLDLIKKQDLALLMSSSEAVDFQHALTSFRNFAPN